MTCEEARARIAQAVLGPEAAGCGTGSLDPETRSHLSGCEECREFLKDLTAMSAMALDEKSATEEATRDLIESRLALPAIESAIEEGLARRDSGARHKGASFMENLAFVLFAIAVLTAQVAIFVRLSPVAVLGLEAGLNWLAPFIFYAIYRLDRRRGREEEGSR